MQVTITVPTPVSIVRQWRWTLLAALVLVLTLAGGTGPARAAFPGANGKIAFNSNRDGNVEIYVMSADGTSQTRLTNNPGADRAPRWSADGTSLVFNRDELDIYKMDADGSNLTQVTFLNYWVTAGGSWSPDGSKIAFGSIFEGGFFNEEIYIMNADGTGITRLTNGSGDDVNPAWSPDGTKIAWCRGASGTPEIYVMNADGTSQTNLTNNPASDCGGVDWSPDGTKIAFYRGGAAEIFVMNADGTGQTQLTSNAFADYDPSWSPDGTKIAFYSDRDGNNEIYTMNANGSAQTRITNNSADDTTPSWQPVPLPLNITSLGQYALPKTCFEVRNTSEVALFAVCDNDYAGAPEADALCIPDGICNDENPLQGAVSLNLTAGSYRVVESTVAPQHIGEVTSKACDTTSVSCTATFTNTPNTRPWHPWDITGAPGGGPNGLVRVDDILAVVQHYHDDKPLP